jgi:hypothetical protein
MEALTDIQKELVETILNIVVTELLILKRSYFSTWGKEGWNPLKPETIARKRENKRDFNTETGQLRDSLKVFYVEENGQYRIKCSAIHKNGDEALKTLIYKYGRNFLDFDNNEQMWIAQRFESLWELAYAE